jgi:phenylpyruvate tautomerase PptA (4-oxalocrotonate tautomerase family)
MPLVSVYTSAELPAEESLKTLLSDLSSTTARVLGKPESYVMTCVVPRSHMTFAGTFAASCLVEVESIGGLGGDSTKRLTEAICRLLHDGLGVPASRMYVVFKDVPARMWGFDGATFG